MRHSGGMDLPKLTGTVVVGDDGSAQSAAAMRWARDDAMRRQVALSVLHAWSITSAPRPRSAEPGYVPGEDEYQAAVMAELSAHVSRTLGDPPGVVVQLLAAHDSAREALVQASTVAALVVVARSGRGLAKIVLGSTADHVVRHAKGPVAVIPESV
jgi:nucleotide-binding universal stress UspA family protein